MSDYTLKDAMNDPERPMNVAPTAWLDLRQRRGSIDESVKVAKETPATTDLGVYEEGQELVMVDQAVDGMIKSIQDMYEALGNLKNLNEKERKAVSKIKDLIDTAVAPYTADIIQALEIFEGE